MFPGASTDRESAGYAIVGAPLDASTTFQPGTRFGPRRVRTYAEPFEDYDHHTDQRFTDLGVHDHGDVSPGGDVDEYLTFLQGTLSDFALEDTVPITVGGEHTVTIAAVRALQPDVYVTLDAHLDLRESFGGDPLSHSTVTRHILAVVDEVVVLGARAGSEEEWNRADADEVTVIAPKDVPDWTRSFDGDDAYLSVDIDAADPGFAPGTGTTEPFGLTPREMRDVVRDVAPHAVGADVVEVNDRDDGQAASLGAKLLREFVFAHAAD
ncbi:arginase family protein [Halobacteriales archaeon Cl-PHB]